MTRLFLCLFIAFFFFLCIVKRKGGVTLPDSSFFNELSAALHDVNMPKPSIDPTHVLHALAHFQTLLLQQPDKQEIQAILVYLHTHMQNDLFLDEQAATSVLSSLPSIKKTLFTDLQKTAKEDPSATDEAEIIAAYPGLFATFVYRVAHVFLQLGHRTVARIMSEYAHRQTGIDIHPGATIGHSFFIDHGTGVVIGETSIIGNHVSIYHGVTLGILSFEHEPDGSINKTKQRHPTIKDGVTIYAEAMVLGGDTVVGENAIIGSHATIVKSVPAGSKIIKK